MHQSTIVEPPAGERAGREGAAPPEAAAGPRRHSWRRLPPAVACLLYMVLLIGGTIGVDRLIAWRLFASPSTFVPAYRSFQDYDIGIKLQQFRGVESQPFTGFFVGNSRTMFGVNPSVFDQTLKRQGQPFHSYNLAEESVDVRFWAPFFTRYYQRHPPHYVFLGLLPRDLDAGYTTLGERYVNAFFASAGFQNRNMSPINRFAEEEMAKLYFLHGRISDARLVSLSDILHGRKLSLHQGSLGNAQGWMRLPQDVLSIPKPFLRAQAAQLAHRRGRQPFVLGTQQAQSLAALNAWVRRGHGCLITYTTPLYYDSEPWGTELMRQGFTQTMHRLTRTIPGLQFVDLGARVQGSYTAADFGDGDHLNGRGAARFSAQLATGLRAAMAASPCRG